VTQPNPDQAAAEKAAAEKAAAEKAAAEKAAAEKAAAEKAAKAGRPKRGQLVDFTHRDPVSGDQLVGIGVVLSSAGEGGITVRPLAAHDVLVDPAEVDVVVVDEV
jgi:hypothetical protein